MAINGIITCQCLSIFAINSTDESFETVSHERYMTTPFHVAGQVTQSDTESSEHHHWNGNSRRQKSAILDVREKEKIEKKEMKNKQTNSGKIKLC